MRVTHPTSQHQSRAWTVLWMATAVQFLGGLLYIWSVVGKALIKSGWTSKQASLPYTTATVAFVISMTLMGRVQDARGPRFVGTLAGLFTGTGLILSGLVHTPLLMTLTFGILVGAYGISTAFICLGAALLVLMVGFAQFLANPPTGYDPNAGVTAAAGKPVSLGSDVDWKGLLKNRDFYKLWLMFAFSSSAGLMIIGHAANIAKIQVGWEKGFLLLIFLALFNAAGRFLGGTISDKIGRINLMRIIFVIQALNMLCFSRYLSIPLLALGVALAGLCYGGSFSVFPATTADRYGMKNFGANYGLVFTAWGLGGIIGPMTAAALLDSTRSYNLSYLVAFALVAIAALITFTFRGSPEVRACVPFTPHKN